MRSNRLKLIICLFLIVSTLVVYWQVSDHDFINFDDPDYITENRDVLSGLTKKGFTWAFTTFHSANWHPITWLSHMLDHELFALDPGKHHLMNLLFHLANTFLLFIVLGKMTGAPWRSGFVAALFALHPLHVESVAWISERKDVLSTFFWMLTMWAYVRYAVRPRFGRYILVVIFFALGLMSKPMLVTLPFVLLLLDYWPLGRLQMRHVNTGGNFLETDTSTLSWLIWEKIPLFALTGASSVVTFLVQGKGGAVQSLVTLPLSIRLSNIVIAYVGYIRKMVFPNDLAVIYPHIGTLAMWQIGVIGLLLVCFSAMLVMGAQRRPYLAVGWLWYLGTLIPVIGLVQVGAQSMADRYTYVPLIGLFIMCAWGVPDLIEKWRYRRVALSISAGILILGLMMCTWFQVTRWKDSPTLFTHALNVTKRNWMAHYQLGMARAEQGKLEQAIAHYSEALRIKSDFGLAHSNLAGVLLNLGRIKEAIGHSTEALKIKPDYAKAHTNLGTALAYKGDINAAIKHYSEALRIDPNSRETHINMGILLVKKGSPDEAIFHFREALRIKPGDSIAGHNLDRLLRQKGGSDRVPYNKGR